ncbi:MAG: hypothetical protein IT503_09790 [Burkholderiaceae bacterium]|nr:hypothetical protein [Ideonella sp.]MCC7286464.1 hypothetical protein [Burkholderiaceae bacterium]
MVSRLPARALSPAQRAQRRQDLALAADLLRRQVGRDLTRLQPAADRLLVWADIALWLRRRWLLAPQRRRLTTVLAAVGGLAGVGSVGAFALRHWRWLRNSLVAWRLWRRLRR